jgi:hypothetical protein
MHSTDSRDGMPASDNKLYKSELANTKGRNCFRTKNGFKSSVYIITLTRFPYIHPHKICGTCIS